MVGGASLHSEHHFPLGTPGPAGWAAAAFGKAVYDTGTGKGGGVPHLRGHRETLGPHGHRAEGPRQEGL